MRLLLFFFLVHGTMFCQNAKLNKDSENLSNLRKKHNQYHPGDYSQELQLLIHMVDSLSLSTNIDERIVKFGRDMISDLKKLEQGWEKAGAMLINLENFQNNTIGKPISKKEYKKRLKVEYYDTQLKAYNAQRRRLRKLERRLVELMLKNTILPYIFARNKVVSYTLIQDYINKCTYRYEEDIIDLEAEITGLKFTKNSLENSKDSLNDILTDLEKDLHIQRIKYNSLVVLNEVIILSNDSLTDKSSFLAGENFKIQNLLSLKEADLVLKSNQEDSLKNNIILLKRSTDKLKEVSEVQITESKETITQLSKRIEALKSEKETLENENEELNQFINDTSLFTILGILFMLMLCYFLYKKHQRQQQLNKANEQLKRYKSELYHRTKNDINNISTLIFRQKQNIEDENAKSALATLESRVNTIALIHKILYTRETKLEQINLKDYLEKLVGRTLSGLGVEPNLDIENLEISIKDATDVGLIVNELITNAEKHAFKGVSHPKFWLKLYSKASSLFLEVKDNGIGFSESALSAQKPSLGLNGIVRELVCERDEKGTFDFGNDKGAWVRISMPMK